MSELFWFLALVLALALNALQLYFHYREKKNLFTKFMAKNLAEAEYYDKEYPGDVKVKKKEQKIKIKEEQKMSPSDLETRKRAEEF